MNKKKINTIVGSIGAFIGVFVFLTYIPQIIANLVGEKALPWQPLTASISCLIWVIYGWTKEPKKRFHPYCSKFSWCNIRIFNFYYSFINFLFIISCKIKCDILK